NAASPRLNVALPVTSLRWPSAATSVAVYACKTGAPSTMVTDVSAGVTSMCGPDAPPSPAGPERPVGPQPMAIHATIENARAKSLMPCTVTNASSSTTNVLQHAGVTRDCATIGQPRPSRTRARGPGTSSASYGAAPHEPRVLP